MVKIPGYGQTRFGPIRLEVGASVRPRRRARVQVTRPTASRVEITREGWSPFFSHIHGNSSWAISQLYLSEPHVFGVPSSRRCGSQPPGPVGGTGLVHVLVVFFGRRVMFERTSNASSPVSVSPSTSGRTQHGEDWPASCCGCSDTQLQREARNGRSCSSAPRRTLHVPVLLPFWTCRPCSGSQLHPSTG